MTNQPNTQLLNPQAANSITTTQPINLGSVANQGHSTQALTQAELKQHIRLLETVYQTASDDLEMSGLRFWFHMKPVEGDLDHFEENLTCLNHVCAELIAAHRELNQLEGSVS